MAELILLDWVAVNSYMREDYRLLIAAMAVRASNNGASELHTMARNVFAPLQVRGARSFYKAALPQQRSAVAQAMPTNPALTSIVIALWAEAAAPQIGILKQAAEMAGAEFSPDWDWKQGMRGFYAFEDTPVLYALAEKLGEHASPQDADHLKLAALWLGPAITNLEAMIPAEENAEEDNAADAPAENE